jgi:hypothetical protein
MSRGNTGNFDYLGPDNTGLQPPRPQNTASSTSTVPLWKKIALGLCILLPLVCLLWWWHKKTVAGGQATSMTPASLLSVKSSDVIPMPPAHVQGKSTQASPAKTETQIAPDQQANFSPSGGSSASAASPSTETVLLEFAFEPLSMPGYVPDSSKPNPKLVQKPAGNPPYKLVSCNLNNGYAVRWNGQYLTSSEFGVQWTESREEPLSCFEIVPGYCGGSKYIFLRNFGDRNFLRYDSTNGKLICQDGPTGRSASEYCWKLESDDAKPQPCGPQYSYDAGKVIDIPCNIQEMPTTDGKSCNTVTPGYQSACCIKKGADAQSDPGCKDLLWTNVVGRPLQEAMLLIRTQRPDLALQPCPEPCTVSAFPTPQIHTVVLPYDARSGIITSPPHVLI